MNLQRTSSLNSFDRSFNIKNMGVAGNSRSFKYDNKIKDLVVFAICLMCIFLFMMSAYEKIVDQARFVRGLSTVIYTRSFAKPIGWLVPTVEIAISLLLINPKTHKLGLQGFIATMVLFTVYILSMVLWADKLPCHCNLIVEKLTWQQHIWFNIAFIAIATYGVIIQRNISKT